MKKNRISGILTGAFAFAFAMILGFGIQIKAAGPAVDTSFFNKDDNNGEAGQHVEYVITKQATKVVEDGISDGEVMVAGCDNVKSIVIATYPSDGEYKYTCVGIFDGAFKNKSALQNVQINDSEKYTAIPANCFSGCKNLKSVDSRISELNKIGKKAFYNCKKLKTIKIYSSKMNGLSKWGVNSFKGVANVKVYGPSKKRAKNYASCIKSRKAKKTSYAVLKN
jgi:hypothetical protein